MNINKKKWMIISGITLLILVLIFPIVFMYYAAWVKRNGTYVTYSGEMFSSNGQYTGVIDTYKNRVSISDQSQQEVSELDMDIEDTWPYQIVLGEKTYFILYHLDDERKGAAKIVQYDYQSVKKQEYIAENVAVIDYKDGYLFTGNWKNIKKVKRFFGYGDDVFYAHHYIAEEEFGEQFKQLQQDASGKCMVGNIELYYHEAGYFSTEPELNDYPLMSKGDFQTDDKDYKAETEQEIHNRSLILSAIGYTDSDYEIYEYQTADNIYGLCNLYEPGEYISILPRKMADIKASYFYEIKPAENEITVLLKKDSCLGLVLSGDEAVYQENNRIMHYNFHTGEEKEIYHIHNRHDMGIYVKKDYLMVVEEKNRVISAVFPTRDKKKSVVKWALLEE